jgi:1-acyl-sn-glycerol-3-phosphate acyltransferase
MNPTQPPVITAFPTKTALQKSPAQQLARVTPAHSVHFAAASKRPYPKPKVKKWFLRLLSLPSRLYIRVRHNIEKVSVRGEEQVKEALAKGHRVIITPNHPGHGDTLMTHPMYQAVGKPFNILVADFFFTNRFISEKWRHRILNARGMFPLNREIPDKQALSAAIEVVESGKHPLVVFPEGISTGRNDELGELKDGIAMISTRAHESISKTPPTQGKEPSQVLIFPTAMRHHYTRPIDQTLSTELERMERAYFGQFAESRGMSLSERLERLGFKAIRTIERRVFGEAKDYPSTLSWPDTHQQSMQGIAHHLAQQLGLTLKTDLPMLDQHRDLTGKIKLLDIEKSKAPRPERKQWQALKKELLPHLNALYEMLKLSPTYTLAPQPDEARHLHRLAEGLYRIEATLNYGSSEVMSQLGPRHTAIVYGKPVNVSQIIQDSQLEAQQTGMATHPKTLRKKIMTAVKQELERLLKDNGPHIPSKR